MDDDAARMAGIESSYLLHTEVTFFSAAYRITVSPPVRWVDPVNQWREGRRRWA
ncbi:MAG: hypothetical protein HY709_02665 [Candidatus Latescibacteria bacterium]|nr:hypothetical protein [Candidatus Latescibacterota bacterium]